MSNKYSEVCQKAMTHVSNGQFEQAMSLLRPVAEHRDPHVLRVLYTIYSRPNSPLRDAQKASGTLDALVSLSDPWGLTEKGRCLLYGELYTVNVADAEDLLVRATSRSPDPKAEYYMGLIYANGLHQVDGAGVFDKAEAKRIFAALSSTQSPYKDAADLQYCRLVIDDVDGMSMSERASLIIRLSALVEKGIEDAPFVYGKLLLSEISSLTERVLSPASSGQTLREMMEQSAHVARVRNGINVIASVFSPSK